MYLGFPCRSLFWKYTTEFLWSLHFIFVCIYFHFPMNISLSMKLWGMNNQFVTLILLYLLHSITVTLFFNFIFKFYIYFNSGFFQYSYILLRCSSISWSTGLPSCSHWMNGYSFVSSIIFFVFTIVVHNFRPQFLTIITLLILH